MDKKKKSTKTNKSEKLVSRKSNKKKSILNAAIKILVSALIIFFLFKMVNFELLIANIKNIKVGFFVLALLLIYPNILMRAIRFRMIINKGGFSISIRDAYRLTLIGSALNIFMPASTGDIVKAYYGYKRHKIREEMLSASLVDKVIALLSLFIIGTISSLFFKFTNFFLIAALCTAIFLAVLLVPKIIPWKLFNKIIVVFAKKKFDERKLVDAFTVDKKLKIETIIISIIGWLITYSQFYLVCRAYSAPVNYIYLLAISPLVMLARLFPLTLNGIGSTEAMITYLFGLIGISVTSAVVISLTNTLVELIIPGIIGLFIIVREK